MAPSAVETSVPELGVTKKQEKQEHRSGDPSLAFVRDVEALPPKFEDKYEEQKFLKHRLALAYRVFANCGFSDGVAGHITMRGNISTLLVIHVIAKTFNMSFT